MRDALLGLGGLKFIRNDLCLEMTSYKEGTEVGRVGTTKVAFMGK